MSVALVTNYLPGYRLPLYELLADRLAVEVFCFGGEGHYLAESARDLERQLEQARFPAHRLERQRDALALARDHDAVVASTAGRVALPAAYTGARRAGRPFLLWASLWRHPRTSVHLASLPLMRSIYRHADAIVTYGPHVSAYVAGLRGSDESVFIAPQAVEPELFGRAVGEEERRAWRAQLGLGPGPLVLYVGRLVDDKGVRVLAEAWKQTRDADKATLCLAGEGPLAADSDLGAAPGLVVAGHIERGSLPVAYAAADMVVVPSIATRRFLEPWGLVCNEAMLQGKPVIASDAVGAAAGGLVRDGETGLVTPAGDANALAAALERLLRDPALRVRLGSRGKEIVREYSYESAAEGFSRALEAAGGPAPGA
jgi:glycosyltransferase involved in cell wall biosynthesis